MFDGVRRYQAEQHLFSTLEAAPDGSVVDVGAAFDEAWDRAVVVSAYSIGRDVDRLLGFDQFAPDALLSWGDTDTRVLFVSGREVVADITLGNTEVRFDHVVETFDRGNARFRVVREGDWATLTPAQ